MKIGMLYEDASSSNIEKRMRLNLMADTLTSEGNSVAALSGCLCSSKDFGAFDAVFYQIPLESEVEGCSFYGGQYPGMEECQGAIDSVVKENPGVDFYFLDIYGKMKDSELFNHSNAYRFDVVGAGDLAAGYSPKSIVDSKEAA